MRLTSLMTPASRSARALPLLGLALGLSASLALGACKNGGGESCNPDDYVFEEIQVLLQGSQQLNLDDEGNPLSVVVRIYQLNGDLATRSLDPGELWNDQEAALGDEYISDKEVILRPETAETIPITVEKDARYVLVAGGFRQPVGNTWFRVYEIPDTYGKQACDYKREEKDPADLGTPCIYLMFERNQIDGGKNVPPGFDKDKVEAVCTPVYAKKTVSSE